MYRVESFIEKYKSNRNQELLHKIFDMTKKLIYKLAIRFIKKNNINLEADELVNESYSIFVRSVECFDPSRNFRFNTFLTSNIEFSWSKFTSDFRGLKFPRDFQQSYNVIKYHIKSG